MYIGDEIGSIAELEDEIEVHMLSKVQLYDYYLSKEEIEDHKEYKEIHTG